MDKTTKVILAIVVSALSLAALTVLGKAAADCAQEAADQESERELFEQET